MIYRLTAVLLLALASLKGSPQAMDLQGTDYFMEGQYSKARDWFLEKTRTRNPDVYLLIRLGDTYLALNNADSARIAYQAALNIDLKNPFAWAGLGKIALLTNDLISQAEYFDRARRADKLNPVIYCNIAEGCLNLAKKDTATARIFLNQGLGIDPKFARLHLVAGLLAEIKMNYGEAVNAYERAVFFDPNYVLAYRKLGVAYLHQRNFSDALKAFNKSISINPVQIQVYKELGNLHYSAGNYKDSETAYKIYMSRCEPTPADRERFAIVLFFNRKYDEASSLLEQLPAGTRNESALFRLKGYIACEKGDFKAGLGYMDQFFSLADPASFVASDHTCYAKMLQKTGKDSLAVLHLNKALALEPGNTAIYEELAQLASKNNEHALAASCYLKMGANGADRLVTGFYAGREFYFEGNRWKNRYDSLLMVQKKRRIPFSDSMAVKETMRKYYLSADSSFTVVTGLNKEYAGGFLWKGRLQSLLDPGIVTTGAKDAYERALALLLKGDQAANQKMIIECYRYLGYFYFVEYEKLYRTNKDKAAESRAKSVGYFSKISALDPADKQANDVISKMKPEK